MRQQDRWTMTLNETFCFMVFAGDQKLLWSKILEELRLINSQLCKQNSPKNSHCAQSLPEQSSRRSKWKTATFMNSWKSEIYFNNLFRFHRDPRPRNAMMSYCNEWLHIEVINSLIARQCFLSRFSQMRSLKSSQVFHSSFPLFSPCIF